MYDYQVIYKSEFANCNANSLLRNPPPSTPVDYSNKHEENFTDRENRQENRLLQINILTRESMRSPLIKNSSSINSNEEDVNDILLPFNSQILTIMNPPIISQLLLFLSTLLQVETFNDSSIEEFTPPSSPLIINPSTERSITLLSITDESEFDNSILELAESTKKEENESMNQHLVQTKIKTTRDQLST